MEKMRVNLQVGENGEEVSLAPTVTLWLIGTSILREAGIIHKNFLTALLPVAISLAKLSKWKRAGWPEKRLYCQPNLIADPSRIGFPPEIIQNWKMRSPLARAIQRRVHVRSMCLKSCGQTSAGKEGLRPVWVARRHMLRTCN